MKTSYIACLLSLFLASPKAIAEPNAVVCVPPDPEATQWTMRSDSDLAYFAAHGCTKLTHRLRIEGTQVTSLAGLSGIRTAHSVILYNTALRDLLGWQIEVLQAEPANGAELIIHSNRILSSLAGLESLSTASRIEVTANASLRTANSLSRLTGDVDMIQVINNPVLLTLAGGTSSLRMRGLSIQTNDQLERVLFPRGAYANSLQVSGHAVTTLSGIPATAALKFVNNDKVRDLSGVELRSSNGTATLSVDGATALHTLDGLETPGLWKLEVAISTVYLRATALENIDALASVPNLKLSVINAAKLSELQGFERVSCFKVSIANSSLGNLGGLGHSTRTSGDCERVIQLSGNALLHDLKDLESTTLDTFEISGSPLLSDLPVMNIADGGNFGVHSTGLRRITPEWVNGRRFDRLYFAGEWLTDISALYEVAAVQELSISNSLGVRACEVAAIAGVLRARTPALKLYNEGNSLAACR